MSIKSDKYIKNTIEKTARGYSWMKGKDYLVDAVEELQLFINKMSSRDISDDQIRGLEFMKNKVVGLINSAIMTAPKNIAEREKEREEDYKVFHSSPRLPGAGLYDGRYRDVESERKEAEEAAKRKIEEQHKRKLQETSYSNIEAAIDLFNKIVSGK